MSALDGKNFQDTGGRPEAEPAGIGGSETTRTPTKDPGRLHHFSQVMTCMHVTSAEIHHGCLPVLWMLLLHQPPPILRMGLWGTGTVTTCAWCKQEHLRLLLTLLVLLLHHSSSRRLSKYQLFRTCLVRNSVWE